MKIIRKRLRFFGTASGRATKCFESTTEDNQHQQYNYQQDHQHVRHQFKITICVCVVKEYKNYDTMQR